MDNLTSVVKKHQRSIKFNELRAEEIAFQNEKRQKHHQNVQIKADLAKKQGRRQQIII